MLNAVSVLTHALHELLLLFFSVLWSLSVLTSSQVFYEIHGSRHRAVVRFVCVVQLCRLPLHQAAQVCTTLVHEERGHKKRCIDRRRQRYMLCRPVKLV